ncbi:hypothetical protein FXO38_29270 [Capsicum annuum]|nr:hypothetical protein FXO38_29270 [Capsicum annuum]
MAYSPHEAIQSSPSISLVPGVAECRNDPHRSISSIPPDQNSTNAGEGPFFCASTWGLPKSGGISSEPSTPVDTSHPQEVRERELTLEALRENSLEMKSILASLRAPRTEVETLGKPVHLTFEDVISKMTIILILQDLLDLEVVPLSPRLETSTRQRCPLYQERENFQRREI